MSRIDGKQFQERMRRIDSLVRTIEAGDPVARAAAMDLMSSFMELHGAGIEQMMEIVYNTGNPGREIIGNFAGDGLVSSLLLLYGLHPFDLETRIVAALDKVRPYLQSHGGNVEILEIRDGVARLRLQGSCNGCASSALTLKNEIEQAIRDAAPDIVALEVEGVVESAPRLVQLGRPMA